MNDAEFKAFQAEADELELACYTEALATKQLQSEGIVDGDAELAAPYREAVCL